MRLVRLSRPKGNVWLHRQEKPNELTCSTESIGRGFRERWRKPAPTLASLGYCFMISRPQRCAACCAAGLPNLYHENQGSGSVCKTDPLAVSASSYSLVNRGPLGRRSSRSDESLPTNCTATRISRHKTREVCSRYNIVERTFKAHRGRSFLRKWRNWQTHQT